MMNDNPDPKPPRRGRYLKWVMLAAVFIAGFLAYTLVLGRPSFDPVKVGQSETRMWQAYYTGDVVRLGLETMSLLRSEYGLTLVESKEIGELLTRSAMQFRAATGNYEKAALPELTEAYRLIKQATGAGFDHEAAARAELAWWVARRTPGGDSAAQVGKKVAELYAILYGGDVSLYLKAGVLRAEAAALRDEGGANADWPRVEELLIGSFQELKQAI